MTIARAQCVEYQGQRNRAVASGHYAPGFKFYEIDLLVRWLRDNAIRFCVSDPCYGICGKDLNLNGAPEVLVIDVPPTTPASRGLAIWIAGARTRRTMSDQESEWVDRMRAIGWQCSVNFVASDALPDLVRLGYLRAMKTPLSPTSPQNQGVKEHE
jgi:hypothetical protein